MGQHRAGQRTSGWVDPDPQGTSEWTADEWVVWSLGPFHGGVPGALRRIRRILDVSQRGLAAILGVSQSAVARWETGRTSPRASVLEQLLELAGLEARLHDAESGARVEPMRDDGARTQGGSRFPAHGDLRADGWWIPRHLRSWTTIDAYRWERRSRTNGDVAIGCTLSPFRKRLSRLAFGTPVDHPSHQQLLAELRHREERRGIAPPPDQHPAAAA